MKSSFLKAQQGRKTTICLRFQMGEQAARRAQALELTLVDFWDLRHLPQARRCSLVAKRALLLCINANRLLVFASNSTPHHSGLFKTFLNFLDTKSIMLYLYIIGRCAIRLRVQFASTWSVHNVFLLEKLIALGERRKNRSAVYVCTP